MGRRLMRTFASFVTQVWLLARGARDLPLAAHLEEHAAEILEELAPLCQPGGRNFGNDYLAQHLARDHTSWTSLGLFHDGSGNSSACSQLAPRTCALLQERSELRGALRSVKSPEMKVQLAFVSVYRLRPGAHIHRHVGNQWRLNTHFGLVTPKGVEIRVWGEPREWVAGKAFAFLDAAEHEVFHHGTEDRCVLNVVGWHPDVEGGARR